MSGRAPIRSRSTRCGPTTVPASSASSAIDTEPSGAAYNLFFEQPSADLASREIVMYNPGGGQDFSSHAFDLLQLTPEEIRRQRGYFRSEELPQMHWRRFLFD